MQFQIVFCCTYNMIFITIFKVKHKLHIPSGSAPPPPPQGKILGVRVTGG
jgi:hypothetical protein